ncbi:hypothetical protein ACFO5O_13380 [Geojedonia litorea]|uniref:Lipoprotein n=1 Tax=Geojedonia litorea TaxID=1268269 RepID=A0ABV9N4Q8_9FLAO
MKSLLLLVFIITLSCSSNPNELIDDGRLSNYLNSNNSVENGAVISCAASDAFSDEVFVFYYPEPGASNIRLYETINTEVNRDDFETYTRVVTPSEAVFNGYLERFARTYTQEKWVIVTFELNGDVKVSNPIRVKQISKPTVWSNNVDIDQQQTKMPIFTWENNAFGDNAIYFQVVTDDQDNLLSGTYTFESHFQYYNTSNVVLNITIEMPPALIIGNNYNFTLMDVSEDNWVNTVIQQQFEVQ